MCVCVCVCVCAGPVCLDDEVSVQDAFSIERCGHRVCRPCALRLVDHNIKQLQPQCCPQCQGAPCPRCPTTIHTQTKEVRVTHTHTHICCRCTHTRAGPQ